MRRDPEETMRELPLVALLAVLAFTFPNIAIAECGAVTEQSCSNKMICDEAIEQFCTASKASKRYDYSGPTYTPLFDFPASKPSAEELPWKAFDPFTTAYSDVRAEQSRKYMDAVLDYVFEGNFDGAWDVENNPVRNWFHAPWLHYADDNGREPIYGLTRELCSQPKTLHANQTRHEDSWAVGYYNAPGGYQLGKVWKDPTKPDFSDVNFPDGTVSFKLLFTTADASEVPYLGGAPEWRPYIWPKLDGWSACNAGYELGRNNLRLIQFDIAVKDERPGNPSGWVFGTFIYHKDEAALSAWPKLRPVGLQWGNDPDRREEAQTLTFDSARHAKPLQEGWMNPEVSDMFTRPERPFLGLHGRVNGPIDNGRSTCLACHAVQAVANKIGDDSYQPTPEGTYLPWHPCDDQGNVSPDFYGCKVKEDRYFANRKGTESFVPGYHALDYSLQLAVSYDNFAEWFNDPERAQKAATGDHGATAEKTQPMSLENLLENTDREDLQRALEKLQVPQSQQRKGR